MKPNLTTVTEVFQQYFKELSICDFPTGAGDWRNELTWQSDLLDDSELSENANLFTIEELKEILKKQPFQKSTEWSKDADQLQNISVENPKKINLKNIKNYFKHLRIIGKDVTTIDEAVGEFSNLTNLIVSANKIKEVNSKVLPRSLKVLELCGNEISDVSCLCLDPPSLQHLGLSYNHLYSICEYIKPNSWKSLLSLDLSFNQLDNLSETVSKLSLLPKLTNLLMQGNPLFLLPWYRGYTIDRIKTLSLLDDNRISADERHLFKGMSELKGLEHNQFLLRINIDNLNGLKRRPDDTNESVVEDFPKVILKYHVELDFIIGYSFEEEKAAKEETDRCCDVTVQTVDLHPKNEYQEEQCKTIKTKEFTHGELLGEEDSIPIKFSKLINSKNMKDFHAYLLSANVRLRIVENRVVISNEPKPASDVNVEPKPINTLKETSKDKQQNTKPKSKSATAKKEDKEKTKAKAAKKQQEVELFEWSRTSHVLGTTTVDCQTLLLEDSTSLKTECIFQRIQQESISQTGNPLPSLDERSSLDGSMTKKGGGTLEPKKRPKDMRRASIRSVSAMKASRMKTVKGDTLQPHDSEQSNNESEERPLRLNLVLNLIRWSSAKEGLSWSQRCQGVN